MDSGKGEGRKEEEREIEAPLEVPAKTLNCGEKNVRPEECAAVSLLEEKVK